MFRHLGFPSSARGVRDGLNFTDCIGMTTEESSIGAIFTAILCLRSECVVMEVRHVIVMGSSQYIFRNIMRKEGR